MKKLLLITTALAVGFAGPAHADPITAIATVISGFTGLGAATALALTQFGIGLGLSAISGALTRPKLPGQNVSFDVKMGDDLPLSFVAGDYATAGKRKYIGSWGDNTRFITEVVEYSALPQGLDGIWVNDEPSRRPSSRCTSGLPSGSPGTIRSGSNSRIVPRPWHWGHAP